MMDPAGPDTLIRDVRLPYTHSISTPSGPVGRQSPLGSVFVRARSRARYHTPSALAGMLTESSATRRGTSRNALRVAENAVMPSS